MSQEQKAYLFIMFAGCWLQLKGNLVPTEVVDQVL